MSIQQPRRLSLLAPRQFAHAKGEVVSAAMISDLDAALRAMGVKEDKEIDGTVATILVIEASGPSWCGRDRLADGFTRQTVMVGQLDHRVSQQLQRPAGATFGRARTGGGAVGGRSTGGPRALAGTAEATGTQGMNRRQSRGHGRHERRTGEKSQATAPAGTAPPLWVARLGLA